MSDTTLQRLRAANPVPDVPALDDRELFAQITTSAPDERLRGPGGRRRRRRFTTAAVVLATMATAGGTAVGISQFLNNSGPVKPPVTRHEYQHAQSQLTLPPGYRWPGANVPSNSVTSVGAGGGHAVAIAQTDWECYWVKAIRSHDLPAQQRAHRALTDILEHHVIVAPSNASENYTPPNPPAGPYEVFADDGGFQYVSRAYTKAAAGHPQQLIQSCRANSG
jgi:hypothetical protein